MLQEAAFVAAPDSATSVEAKPQPRRLRILFITEDEPFYMSDTFRRLGETRPQWLDVAAVALLNFAPVGTKGGYLKRVASLARTYGARTTALSALRLLSQWARPSRRLGPILRSNGVEMVRIHDVNDARTRDLLDRIDPDVIVTMGLNRIVSAATLAGGRAGWVNIHLGLLPHNRGPAPVFWALHDGDAELGVSIHMVVERIDAGPVLVRKTRPAASRILFSEVRQLRMLSVEALFEALEKFGRGDIPPPPELPLPKAHRRPSRDDVRSFISSGNRFI